MSVPHADVIGVWGPWLEAPDPVDASERRRFVQAAMEDPERFGTGTTQLPALYPLHAARRAQDSDDPFDRLAEEPDWDGADLGWESAGLTSLGLERVRAVNAGSRVELHRLAELGDRIRQRSCYAAIDEREGRSGPMTRVVVRTEYADQDGAPLLTIDNTIILR